MIDGAICQRSVCEGACVDTSTGALHCGACSRPCPTGRVCSNGACIASCPGKEIARASSSHDVSGGAIVVGAERIDGTEFFDGDIAEILVCAGAFSDAERASVTRYLIERHGIVAQ